jgi:hypothetical protein
VPATSPPSDCAFDSTTTRAQRATVAAAKVGSVEHKEPFDPKVQNSETDPLQTVAFLRSGHSHRRRAAID